MELERSCPRCSGPVISEFGCHTWQKTRDDGTEQWMACLPCDSATIWYCAVWTDEDELDEWMIKGEDTGSGCGWHWNANLNPENPRSAENNEHRPDWAETL